MVQIIVEIIVMLCIILWYFKSAKSIGKNPWLWSILSLFIFFIPANLWSYFVIPFAISIVHTDSALVGNIILLFLALSSVVFGLIIAKFFHWGYLERQKNENDWPESV